MNQPNPERAPRWSRRDWPAEWLAAETRVFTEAELAELRTEAGLPPTPGGEQP